LHRDHENTDPRFLSQLKQVGSSAVLHNGSTNPHAKYHF
jgi:hypothetical protein